MTVLLGLSGPVTPPPPPPSLLAVFAPPHLTMTWTGWDGTVFDLTDQASPVRLKQGVRGLHEPGVQRFSDTSPALAGSLYRGFRTLERDVFWPVAIYGAEAFFEADRAFWRTMDPGRPGVWAVTAIDGSTRRLLCRFAPDAGHVFRADPSPIGWAAYGVSLVADDQPYWQADPIVRRWKAADAVPFFPGPPFRISSGSTLASAKITNPGDVETYPVWTLTGPFTSATVGVGGLLVEVPSPLGAGRSMTVDTDPSAYSAVLDDGTDVTRTLGRSEFVPIPAGESVSLSLSMIGSGAVSAQITPLYRRAW